MSQMYIMVPGAWWGGHEEPCRVRTVDCCHGPGAVEWGVIAAEHVAKLRQTVLQECDVDIYSREGEW